MIFYLLILSYQLFWLFFEKTRIKLFGSKREWMKIKHDAYRDKPNVNIRINLSDTIWLRMFQNFRKKRLSIPHLEI